MEKIELTQQHIRNTKAAIKAREEDIVRWTEILEARLCSQTTAQFQITHYTHEKQQLELQLEMYNDLLKQYKGE